MLLVISASVLSVCRMRLYAQAPAAAPANGPKMYTHSAVYLLPTIAGPMLLTGFIDAPDTGLHANDKPHAGHVWIDTKRLREYKIEAEVKLASK